MESAKMAIKLSGSTSVDAVITFEPDPDGSPKYIVTIKTDPVDVSTLLTPNATEAKAE